MEIKSISEFSRSITHDKKFLMDKLNESYTRYANYISKFKCTLSNIIEVILGQPAPESEVLPPEPDHTPEPRKKSSKKK
jgi:hypothetical protein